jgi:hypothetical protein
MFIPPNIHQLMAMFRAPVNKKSDMELFIESKNPQSTAEVEYWMRVYEQQETV